MKGLLDSCVKVPERKHLWLASLGHCEIEWSRSMSPTLDTQETHLPDLIEGRKIFRLGPQLWISPHGSGMGEISPQTRSQIANFSLGN